MSILFTTLRDGHLQAAVAKEDKWQLAPLAVKTPVKRKLSGNLQQVWEIPVLPNLSELRNNFRRENFTEDAINTILVAKETLATIPYPGLFPGTPMPHQRRALELAHNKHYFFFAHDTGTGKTYTILTLAAHLHRHQGLKGLVVLCPATIINDVWESQIKTWYSEFVDYRAVMVQTGKYNKALGLINDLQYDGLKILVASIESMSNDNNNAYKIVDQFLTTTKSAMVVDEASRIKTHDKKRTENTIYLGEKAHWRWAMTGTKITQGIHDLFSQYQFLDWSIIGHRSYFTFKSKYVIFGGFEGRQILGYNHVPELLDRIRPFTHEVRKKDANWLPPKVYQTRHVDPTAEQRRVYKELVLFMETELAGTALEVTTILERETRLQQIAGGNFPVLDKETGLWSTMPMTSNPKLDEMLTIIDDIDGKMIIWARFVPEITAIISALTSKYGDGSVAAYYGGVDRVTRSANIERFRSDDDCRFFVANQQTGSIGLTLTEATTAIYFSNSFSYEDRYQSEDRCHRTGQKNSVTYIDLITKLPIDTKIAEAIAKKQSMAQFVSNNLSEYRL